MRRIVHNITYAGDYTFRLVDIADTHIGHASCDEHALRDIVDYIATTPNCYWCAGGDIGDCIGRNQGDKRSRESELAPWLHGEDKIYVVQRHRIATLLKPIGPRLLFWLKGNHEDTALSRYGVDTYWQVIEEVVGHAPGDLALGHRGFCKLQFRRDGDKAAQKGYHSPSVPLTIYASHGSGGGSMAGGRALKLERLVRSYEADILLLHHLHAFQTVDGERVALNNANKIVEKRWHALYGGTYLRGACGEKDEGAENYADRCDLPPGPIGSPEIEFTPASGKIKVSSIFF